MDVAITEFITRTDTEPSVARDLLEGHHWDVERALETFFRMRGYDLKQDRTSMLRQPNHTLLTANNKLISSGNSTARSQPINIVQNRASFSPHQYLNQRQSPLNPGQNSHIATRNNRNHCRSQSSDMNLNRPHQTNHLERNSLYELRQKSNTEWRKTENITGSLSNTTTPRLIPLHVHTNSLDSCQDKVHVTPRRASYGHGHGFRSGLSFRSLSNTKEQEEEDEEDDDIARAKQSNREADRILYQNTNSTHRINNDKSSLDDSPPPRVPPRVGSLGKCDSEPSLSTSTSNSASTMNSHENINRLDEDDEEGVHNGEHSNSPSSSVNSSPSKLAISKDDDFIKDNANDPPKKLTRGISRATNNVNLVSRARNEFAADFRTSNRGSRILLPSTGVGLETPDYTFTLPDLSIHPDDFRQFLEQDLVEKSTLVSLEQCGRLNWWSDLGACQRLWPLATSGDGNCLLHAASLGMWGFHDRLLTLRKALHALLVSSTYTDSFYRRWRWQTSMQNKEAGLVYCEEEWQKEWSLLLKMASTEPRLRANATNDSTANSDSVKVSTNTGQKIAAGGLKENTTAEDEIQPHVYESLEELHILALAHVLKRPIIVIADTMLKDVTGEPFAPIPFGGIYLPVECSPQECHRTPLCLTYDAAHFSALVSMDSVSFADKSTHPPAVIPLVDPDHKLLPLQFVVEPGKNVKWGTDENDTKYIKKVTLTDREKLCLLNEYLDVVHVTVPDKLGEEVVVETPNYHLRWEDPAIDDKVEIKGQDVRETKNEPKYSSVSDSVVSCAMKSLTLPHSFGRDSKASSCSSRPGSKCNSPVPPATDAGDPAASTSPQSSCNDKSTMTAINPTNNNRALRRWHSFTRHFGSLGRTMSKRFKKPFNSLAKRGASFRRPSKSNSENDNSSRKSLANSSAASSATTPSVHESPSTAKQQAEMRKEEFEKNYMDNHIATNVIVAAVLHLERRHEYHDEMIRNYLTTARVRFLAKKH